MDPKAMYTISYGLYVVTTEAEGKQNGCISNTVGQVTGSPNQISLTLNKANLTCEMIEKSNKFTVSVISQKADFSLFRRFGFQSGRDADKFAGLEEKKKAGNGTWIVTEGTNAWLSAWVTQKIDLGTHIMFIATVTDMERLSDAPSVTYQYYQDNIKPKPEKVGQTKDGQTVWRCRICGYEYVGAELPEDYICPICKHPASDFEKVG